MYKQNYDVIPSVKAIAITNHPSSSGLPLKVGYTDNNITYIYLSVANKNFNFFFTRLEKKLICYLKHTRTKLFHFTVHTNFIY